MIRLFSILIAEKRIWGQYLAGGILSAELIKNTFTFLSGCERYLLLHDADPVRSNHIPHWLLAFVKVWESYNRFLDSKGRVPNLLF